MKFRVNSKGYYNAKEAITKWLDIAADQKSMPVMEFQVNGAWHKCLYWHGTYAEISSMSDDHINGLLVSAACVTNDMRALYRVLSI